METKQIDVAALIEWQQQEKYFFILDARTPGSFSRGYIPDSIFIGPDENAATIAATVVPTSAPLIVVTEKGREEDDSQALGHAGFADISFLSGGFEAWEDAGHEIDMLINVDADELMMDLPYDDQLVVMDVREEAEFAQGHLDEAENVPLKKLTDPGSMAMIEDTDNIYTLSGNGDRSVTAASLLKRQGIHNVRNVVGGWKAVSRLLG
jgi:rhodanese-related sulfurtransferase